MRGWVVRDMDRGETAVGELRREEGRSGGMVTGGREMGKPGR
jgi:hypothetical protein